MMSLQKYEDLKNFVTMATGILNALYVSVVYTWNWLPLANKGIKSETKQKKKQAIHGVTKHSCIRGFLNTKYK